MFRIALMLICFACFGLFAAGNKDKPGPVVLSILLLTGTTGLGFAGVIHTLSNIEDKLSK